MSPIPSYIPGWQVASLRHVHQEYSIYIHLCDRRKRAASDEGKLHPFALLDERECVEGTAIAIESYGNTSIEVAVDLDESVD